MVIRTDLALEAREMIDEERSEEMQKKGKLPNGMYVNTRDTPYVYITDIEILSKEAEHTIGKKMGKYITLEIKNPSLDTNDIQENISRVFSNEIYELIQSIDIEEPRIMIAGLGNRNITADSLGPKVADKIVVTRHVKNMSDLKIDERLGNVCAIIPGVMGITGIETGDIIKGVVETVKPDILFVIDALASRKASRVNSTIQISDTGIVPGSGVGNHRMELSENTLGIPVIAVGVPTVVDALTLVKDLYNDDNIKPSENDTIANMVVTPKNIDIAIDRIAEVVASGFNLAVHRGFGRHEINEYLI